MSESTSVTRTPCSDRFRALAWGFIICCNSCIRIAPHTVNPRTQSIPDGTSPPDWYWLEACRWFPSERRLDRNGRSMAGCGGVRTSKVQREVAAARRQPCGVEILARALIPRLCQPGKNVVVIRTVFRRGCRRAWALAVVGAGATRPAKRTRRAKVRVGPARSSARQEPSSAYLPSCSTMT